MAGYLGVVHLIGERERQRFLKRVVRVIEDDMEESLYDNDRKYIVKG